MGTQSRVRRSKCLCEGERNYAFGNKCEERDQCEGPFCGNCKQAAKKSTPTRERSISPHPTDRSRQKMLLSRINRVQTKIPIFISQQQLAIKVSFQIMTCGWSRKIMAL